MCNLKNLVAVCLLLASCMPASAFAFNETLTFRINAQGEIEAVIQGFTYGAGCDPYPDGVYFLPPKNIVIAGNTVLVQSPVPAGCSISRYPPFNYLQVANLGHLIGETYQVTWQVGLNASFPVRSLSATLNVSDPYSVAAPALSSWALGMLSLSMVGAAFAALRKQGARLNR